MTHSTLFRISPSSHLTSKTSRLGPRTLPVLLATVLRKVTCADLFVLSAGSVRANRDYEDEEFFTYGMLKSEMPFRSESAVVPLPGKVVDEVIRYSRMNARKCPPVEVGGYLQVDDQVVLDSAADTIASIAGEPFDPERIYRIGIDVDMISGMDNNQPLINYCKGARMSKPEGLGAKELIVSYFSKQIWIEILSKLDFKDIDVDGDGFIEKEELLAAAQARRASKSEGGGSEGSFPELTEVMIENLFCVADANIDGKISKEELQVVSSNSIVRIHKKIRI